MGRDRLFGPRLSPLRREGTGLVNLCRGCSEDFSSVTLFDVHRVGQHEYTHSEGLNRDPLLENGRRCLAAEEMAEKGWERNGQGRWVDPVRVERAREAFKKGPEPQTVDAGAPAGAEGRGRGRVSPLEALVRELPEDVLAVLAARLEGHLRERRRWADIEGVAEYLFGEATEESIRQVRQLRERGLPARKPGRRLIFDLREVDNWLEREAWT
jgi:hypothetical protein